MRSFLTRHHPSVLFAVVVLVTAFVVFAQHRQRFVGGADLYGYYEQAASIRAARVHLPLEAQVAGYAAAVPFGYIPTESGALPQYPPGFPLLLALAGVVGGEFLVTPLLGALSGFLVFLILRRSVAPWTAAVFGLLWTFFPIVAYSSTILMSDVVSATALLAAWWLYLRGNLGLSALVLGFSFSIRPTNVLFLVALALPLARDRQWLRYACWLALPCALYAIYNHLLFGAPWRTGYGGVGSEFQPDIFPSHLAFYSYQTVRQLGWPVEALALLGLFTRHRDRWFHFLWFVPFFVFYCFWLSGGDRWWWTRFLLPGYAALFFLAAPGFERVQAWVLSRITRPAWHATAKFALLGLLGLSVLSYVRLARNEQDVWVPQKGIDYYYAVRRLAEIAPPGSYVGSIEFAGSVRLYSDLRSFLTFYDDAIPLAETVLRHGREVYLMIEPWRQDDPAVLNLLTHFPHQRLADIPVWGGLPVYRLSLPPVR